MKIRFNRMLSIICAVMLMTSAVSVWAAAEDEPATPTDLKPAETETVPEEKEEEKAEPEQEPEQEPEKEPEKEPEESAAD